MNGGLGVICTHLSLSVYSLFCSFGYFHIRDFVVISNGNKGFRTRQLCPPLLKHGNLYLVIRKTRQRCTNLCTPYGSKDLNNQPLCLDQALGTVHHFYLHTDCLTFAIYQQNIPSRHIVIIPLSYHNSEIHQRTPTMHITIPLLSLLSTSAFALPNPTESKRQWSYNGPLGPTETW